ncbi:MAG: hypothetical protein JWR84_2958 [Caulobacter sp.]|nr:hypothetical protein [Caulobacter sp.]
MHFTCVGMGYCGWTDADGQMRHVTDFIPDEGPVSADQFVEWVLLAEGRRSDLTPLRHKRQLRQTFVDIMGGAVVDARRRWPEADTSDGP